jgi:hypothetical protein
MKILIISGPRCGSTSLMDNICLLTNSERIAEPYTNPKELITREPYPYPLELSKKCVAKMITYQIPEEYGEPNQFLNFIKLIYKDYDKIILLNRKNLQEHFESFINLVVRLNKKNVHAPWYIDDIEKHKRNFHIEELVPHREMIDKISIELSIPIIYYEDLYGEDREKSFNIISKLDLELDSNLLNEKLHPQNKYRQKESKRPLL